MREKLERIRDLVEELLREVGPAEPAALINEQPAAPQDFQHAADWPEVRSLLMSDEWPEAVFSAQITDENSERDKEERAEGIADIILPPIEGKRFLDFGCGEGHVAKYVSKEANVSVGYDIVRSAKSQLAWEEQNGSLLLTTDPGRVAERGPYDFILMYDVLDHVVGDSAAALLSKAAGLLSDAGRIYLRCHPWCGRHGGHLYRKLNKAFAHLILSDDELRSVGVEQEHGLRVIRPLQIYSEAIKAAGLFYESEPEIDSQEVESFFKDVPVVRDRILRHWGVDLWDNDPPAFQMSQCFVDYTLTKKTG